MQLRWFNIKYFVEKDCCGLIQEKSKKDNKKFTITPFTSEDITMSKRTLSTK